MSFWCKTGTASFAAGSVSAVTISTAGGSAIKVIWFYLTRQSADGTTDAMHIGFGAASGTTARFAVCANDSDNAATSVNNSLWVSDGCLIDLTTAGGTTVDFKADVSTWQGGANLDQVTITPSNAPTVTTRVVWVALGGTEVSAFVGSSASAPSTTPITGVGFAPTALIVASPHSGTAGTVSGNYGITIGAASSTATGDQASTAVYSANSAATMGDSSRQLTNRIINRIASNAEGGQAHVSTFDADGFTFAVDSSVFGGGYGYIALGGTARYKVISDTAATSVTTKAKTGVGFQPVALPLIASACMAASASVISTGDTLGISLGAYDGTTQGAIWNGQQDANTAALDAMRQSTALAVINAAGANVVATGSSTTFPATATVSALGSDGFTMNWTAADATAREFWVLAVAGAAVATPKSLVYQPRARGHLLRR